MHSGFFFTTCTVVKRKFSKIYYIFTIWLYKPRQRTETPVTGGNKFHNLGRKLQWHYNQTFSFQQLYGSREDFLKFKVLLLYGHFCPTLGPKPLTRWSWISQFFREYLVTMHSFLYMSRINRGIFLMISIPFCICGPPSMTPLAW